MTRNFLCLYYRPIPCNNHCTVKTSNLVLKIKNNKYSPWAGLNESTKLGTDTVMAFGKSDKEVKPKSHLIENKKPSFARCPSGNHLLTVMIAL